MPTLNFPLPACLPAFDTISDPPAAESLTDGVVWDRPRVRLGRAPLSPCSEDVGRSAGGARSRARTLM